MYILSMVVVHIHTRREYWMIYRGPGFLDVVWFGSSPTLSPLSRQQVVSLSLSSCVSPVNLTDWREIGGFGGGGAKSYEGEKVWSSINHSILSAHTAQTGFILVCQWFPARVWTVSTFPFVGCRGSDKNSLLYFHCLVYLKVHKTENFFDSDFGMCVISLLVMSKY